MATLFDGMTAYGDNLGSAGKSAGIDAGHICKGEVGFGTRDGPGPADAENARQINVLAVFVISYLVQYISIERTQALTIVMIAALLMCPFILIAGRLADRYGRGMVYGVSSLLCGLSIFPSFWLMEGSGGSLFLIALAIIIPISVFYAGVFGPEAALFSDLFPPDVRYTGISIVYQFPGFLVAGIVPGLCTFLINWNEGDPLYVCLFTLLAAVTSALSAFAIQRKSIAARRRHGDDAEHI